MQNLSYLIRGLVVTCHRKNKMCDYSMQPQALPGYYDYVYVPYYLSIKKTNKNKSWILKHTDNKDPGLWIYRLWICSSKDGKEKEDEIPR